MTGSKLKLAKGCFSAMSVNLLKYTVSSVVNNKLVQFSKQTLVQVSKAISGSYFILLFCEQCKLKST